MTIPVRNIYYLLLYAWGHFKDDGLRNVGIDDSPDLPNLLGRVLNDGVHRLLRRGLDRGYVEITEETRSPRGTLRLDLMIKQQTLLRCSAVCYVDELTSDVLHNQILRSSLLSLAGCRQIEKGLKRELQMSARRMVGVSAIRLSATLFHRVQLSRNTAQYGLLMRICELVFHSLLPDDKGNGSKFRSILDDETRMSAVFEDFLRNFYRSELPEYRVKSEIMKWRSAADEAAHLAFLPEMKTDITLSSRDRTIVADAKYYKDVLAGGRYGKKLRSDHLYQLSTYLAHKQAEGLTGTVSGLLIYPSIGADAVRLKYRLLDIPVAIATVNLGAEWCDIRSELCSLIRG